MAAGKDSGGFQHCALFYPSQEQYLGEVGAFVRAALARGDPVLITVPGIRAGPLRDVLGPQARQVIFAGMDELGRNPGRIIPAVHAFLDRHPAGRPHWVSEAAWPARSPPELVETARHEALFNRAFAGVPIAALCPYDVTGLPATVLAMAEQTHPLLARPGGPLASPVYLGPEGMPAYCQEALPAPPAGAEVLRYRTDLRPVRALADR